MDKKILTIDVSHGTTHDGPGMRTTVFMKGCPLRCLWCQNPESVRPDNEVWWSARDCIGCSSCVEACGSGALTLDETGIHIDRERCIRCGACAEICPSTAMSWQAQEYDLDSLLSEVLRYRNYYDEFGGGVTCSGGEPLLHSEFVADFFRRLQSEGVTAALDTCGFVSRECLERVLPWTNYVLYDVKLYDSEAHKRFTGVPNELILDNLIFTVEYIRHADHPMELWIRTPLIPGITAVTENIRAVGGFLRTRVSDVLTRWELCAFNGVCVSKYEKLGIKWAFDGQGAMTDKEIAPLREAAESLIPKEKVLVTGMIRKDR